MAAIYLDHNSTTPLLPAAWDAMRPFAVDTFANPASAHHAGRAARRALEDARERVAHLLGAEPDEVVWTSGATEGNNAALFGLAGGSGGHVVSSPVEHPCVAEPVKELAARGFGVATLPVTDEGVVPTNAVRSRLRAETRLVAVMLANHETGAVQPVRELAAGVPATVAFHTDAAQAVGKVPVSFRELGVTTLTASAHKFGGPKGVGVLLVKRGTTLRPSLFGGHQQAGRRPGTEPVALAVGLAIALDHAVHHMADAAPRLALLRRDFVDALAATAGPVVVHGPADGLPTTVSVSFPGCRADVLLMALDLAGVACSAGAACASGTPQPSPTLRAMGVADDLVRSAIRFSFGPDTTLAEADDAAGRIAACVARVRGG